jgi:hypothetical protein
LGLLGLALLCGAVLLATRRPREAPDEAARGGGN